VDEARIYHWLRNGAQPSESVEKLLKITGTLDRYARLKAGEAEETLLAEAVTAAAQRPASNKTSDVAANAARPSKKQRKATEAPAG
jgi:small subunit ribosomal protein S16